MVKIDDNIFYIIIMEKDLQLNQQMPKEQNENKINDMQIRIKFMDSQFKRTLQQKENEIMKIKIQKENNEAALSEINDYEMYLFKRNLN